MAPESDSALLNVALVETDNVFFQHIEHVLIATERVKEIRQFKSPSEALQPLANGEFNTLMVNPFCWNATEAISLISATRSSISHVPICLIGTQDQLANMPGMPKEWARRFSHYYKLAKDLPAQLVREQTHVVTDLCAFYYSAKIAMNRLQDLQALMGHYRKTETPSSSNADKMAELLQGAINALELRHRSSPPSVIIPGFGDDDIQGLVKETLGRAHDALERNSSANKIVLLTGAGIVVASLIVASIKGSWESVAFGGFGIAGVIAALITNPLRSIAFTARRLVQIQVAYLGFLQQLSLLSRDVPKDENATIERSKQLNDAVNKVLQSLETHFGQ